MVLELLMPDEDKGQLRAPTVEAVLEGHVVLEDLGREAVDGAPHWKCLEQGLRSQEDSICRKQLPLKVGPHSVGQYGHLQHCTPVLQTHTRDFRFVMRQNSPQLGDNPACQLAYDRISIVTNDDRKIGQKGAVTEKSVCLQ